MPLTQLEQELRLLARDRIQKTRLPRAVPTRMWGGKGEGRLCALCDQPITSGHSELEVERIDGGSESLFFHVLCQSLWQVECVREETLANK